MPQCAGMSLEQRMVGEPSRMGRKVASSSGGGVQLPAVGYAFELVLAPLVEGEP